MVFIDFVCVPEKWSVRTAAAGALIERCRRSNQTVRARNATARKRVKRFAGSGKCKV